MQLTQLVFAPIGTMADTVMQEMARLNRTRGSEALALDFRAYAGDPPMVGVLVLEPSEKRSGTFSLKYRLGSSGALIIPIGTKLPESRVEHVATSILAMIARGRDWEAADGQIHEAPYGPQRQKNNSRSRSRARVHGRMGRRRSTASLPGGCCVA